MIYRFDMYGDDEDRTIRVVTPVSVPKAGEEAPKETYFVQEALIARTPLGDQVRLIEIPLEDATSLEDAFSKVDAVLEEEKKKREGPQIAVAHELPPTGARTIIPIKEG